MRINFDFADLEVFLSVKETGSFHRAASRLGLSQPSVTRRIRKLEEALGSQLFERTTREVRPTLAAKRLQVRAEAILNDAQETTRAMRDESEAFAHQRALTVTLATIPTVVSGIVAPAINAFRKKTPRTRVRLLDLAANEVAEAVAQGEADFGLCSVPLLEPATEFEPLFTDPIVLAVRAEDPLAAQSQLNWSDVGNAALILPARGTGNRLLIDEALARANVPIRWTHEVRRTSTALDLVAAGVGIAPLPRSALSAYMAGAVVARPVSAPSIARPIGLLTRSGQRDDPATAGLVDAIRSTTAQRFD
ncbi:LysR family transcriptional regulator [Oricola indica]|uniref:LysR family transcriptional regulator n=1 Tax=Oricola indica TaxID=2872591 RepID=UPI003CCB9086